MKKIINDKGCLNAVNQADEVTIVSVIFYEIFFFF